MTANQFLVTSLCCFLATLAGYVVLIDRMGITRPAVSSPYSQFLLESAGSIQGKVIVDSGSNSVHGIDTEQLSDYFQAPVLVTASTAGFPLGPKIWNLSRYLLPGDVLILPLEWNQYVYPDSYPDDYIASLYNSDTRRSQDYTNLPLWEKITFIFTRLPFTDAISAVWQRLSQTADQQAQRRKLNAYQKRLHSGPGRAFGGNLQSGPKKPSLGVMRNGRMRSCDDYIFAQQKKNGLVISEAFIDALAPLKALRAKGVNIYFTWPAVADHASSQCYQGQWPSTEALQAYVSDITALTESVGAQFIGSPEQQQMPAHCFLDTYYHLTQECAQTRTHILVQLLADRHIATLESTVSAGEMLDRAARRITVAKKRLQGSRAQSDKAE
ncbi:MAG: hypothetical protein V7746_10870 [Halioglobus sp.]